MESYQIIAGFSDIKSEFRTKAGINKSLQDLHLWFSFEDQVLYVHDYEEHKKSMVLAVKKSKQDEWKIFMRKHSFAERVTRYGIEITIQGQIAETFNALYSRYGFAPFRRG